MTATTPFLKGSPAPAVLEYGPTEILPQVGALSKHAERLCRPGHQASRAHPRGKPGFWTFEIGCGRETDSPLEERRFELSVPLAVKTLLRRAFRRPTLCGSNPEGHGGGGRRYEFDCVCQYLAADLRHRAQPCSGCAGNFRSRHLIPGVRCQRCSKASTVAEAMRVASGIASSGRSHNRSRATRAKSLQVLSPSSALSFSVAAIQAQRSPQNDRLGGSSWAETASIRRLRVRSGRSPSTASPASNQEVTVSNPCSHRAE